MNGVGRLLGFLLDRLYAEWAWAYDAVSWLVSLGRWGSWRRVALRYLRGERVLEVGCGTGHLLLELADRGKTVCGCDLSAQMLRRARRRVRRAGLDLPLCRARAQELPFAAGAFDTVLCTFPAPFIGDPRTWCEFERVLAPGGRVVVVYGVRVGRAGLGSRWVRLALALSRTDRARMRPAWEPHTTLCVEHMVVMEGADRVGLLLGERKPVPASDTMSRAPLAGGGEVVSDPA